MSARADDLPLSAPCVCGHMRSAHDARVPHVCDFNAEHPQPGRAIVRGAPCRCKGFKSSEGRTLPGILA